MKWNRCLPIVLLLSGCAHLGATPVESLERVELWDKAHGYFATGNYAAADSVFSLIAEQYPETDAGRESLFYLGAIHLDPRNPDWDPEPAEAHLEGYLAAETPEGLIHRRPEGETLYQLAHQFNLPMEERIEGMQSPVQRTTVVVQGEAPQGPEEENARLRQELAAREAEVAELREELERIRKTLTGGQGL